MKKNASLLAISMTLFGILSCNSNLLLTNSKASPRKETTTKEKKNDTKKANSSTIAKINKENSSLVKEDNIKKGTPPAVKKSTTIIYKEKATSPTPPPSVEKIFYSDYPTAQGAVWAKEPSFVKSGYKITSDYKVYFFLLDNKNSIVYTEMGDLVETRMQILPVQLPPNIYSAIKAKYPEAEIVYAATYKNSHKSGSYIALIRTKTPYSEKEIMLMENGTFVE